MNEDPTELPGPLLDALRSMVILTDAEPITREELEERAEHRTLDLISIEAPLQAELGELVDRGFVTETDGGYAFSDDFRESEVFEKFSGVTPEYRETLFEIPIEGGEMSVNGNHGVSQLDERVVEDGTFEVYRDESGDVNVAMQLESTGMRLHGDIDAEVPDLLDYLTTK